VAHARAGHQLQHGVQHAEAGSKDRHHHHVGGTRWRWHSERRPHRLGPGRQLAQGFSGQQDADSDGQAPERVRLGCDVAKREQDVLDERMADEDDGHAQTIHEGARTRLPHGDRPATGRAAWSRIPGMTAHPGSACTHRRASRLAIVFVLAAAMVGAAPQAGGAQRSSSPAAP